MVFAFVCVSKIISCCETSTDGILNLFFVIGFQENGSVTIGGLLQLSYAYNADAPNSNLRSIGGFSTNSADVFINCPRCPLATYQLFVNYFGDFTYADEFVQAAMDGSATDLLNGNVDFGTVAFEGRAGKFANAVVLPGGNIYYFVCPNINIILYYALVFYTKKRRFIGSVPCCTFGCTWLDYWSSPWKYV
jgi:hypothetical protein